MSSVEQRMGGSSFLQVIFDRFDFPELQSFVRRWSIDLAEVKSLKRTSAKIQAYSDEAEMKQFTSDAVTLWLDDVKQLLYDAEDVLDEFATELLRLKLEYEYQTHRHQVQQSGTESTVCNIIEELLGIEGFKSKVRDINERLKIEAQEGVALGLNSGMGSESSKTRVYSQKTSSVVNISEVFGRDDDKEEIVKWLLRTPQSSSNNNFSVLSIVGMGGAGKTTLAKLVYNDEIVENSKYFDLKAWVCVSDNFDEARLTKEILDSATKSSHTSDSLDMLQVKLQETLSRKRFLLILDDMWNDDYEKWYALRIPFAFAKSGSKILVTTRNKQVSSIVRTDPNDHDHDLKGLSDDYCFALFKRHAFMDRNSSEVNRKLDEFGQKIVKKCKGLPLAVKTLAGLLRVKKENWEWEEILENEIWDLTKNKTKILPSLMLSYHHLPPLLKRCFEYCALFPKDYVFYKIKLVLLWMAEGIILPDPKGKKRLEDIGASYFDELFMRSFFELSLLSNEPTYSKTKWVRKYMIDKSFFESSSTNTGYEFVMHDMIHDLAQFVSGGIYCQRVKHDIDSSQVRTTTRHLSCLTQNFTVEATEYKALKSLRTIFGIGVVHKSRRIPIHFQFQFLRVLCFGFRNIRELPDSIGKLKHLRFFDLIYCRNIERLPDSITTLYNLQTLILIGCTKLKELPEDIGNLVNLRHLCLPTNYYYEGCNFHKMPLGVGNLTGLQTLNQFIASSKNSSALREFSQLRGSLEISKLENFGNINGAETMVGNLNLKNKPHILGLELRWSYLGKDEKLEENVLDQLKPHTNLEALWIENYGGTRFPRWMEHPFSFSNLGTLYLVNCRKCRFLPHLKQLPLLKHLRIEGNCAMKMVGSELYGDSSSSSFNVKQFRSLETLHIESMEEWEDWPEVDEEGGGQFPCLYELTIKECPKLKKFSHHFPSLVILRTEKCGDLRELPRLLPSVLKLSIWKCPKLVVLPSLPSIEWLYLSGCDQITTLSNSNHPSSSSTSGSATCVQNSFPCLKKLSIFFCPYLRELPCTLPLLESLEIVDCKEFCFHPMLPSIKELKLKRCKGMTAPDNKMLLELSSLVSLTINEVSDLKSLSNGFMQHLTTLQQLKILNCRELSVLLQNEIGIDLLPSSLQHLCIHDCDNIGNLPQSMCNLNCLQELTIEGAKGFTSLSEGLQNLTSLRFLRISRCQNLESLLEKHHTLMSLWEFIIESCPALVSFQETRLPSALQKLVIRDCKNLESLPKELHTLTSLQELVIESFPALVSFQITGLPTTLQKLEIRDCKNLESLPKELHTLSSLREFVIKNCPALVSFQVTGLPTMLQKLEIRDSKNLDFLAKGLHKLMNLRHLKIVECSSLIGCKSQEIILCGHLTSLQSLSIGGFPALISIPKGMLPTKLQSFYINDCPILESLYDGLSDLTSLEGVYIRNCPMLRQRYHAKEGEEWSKITQIPRVYIDGQEL